MFDWFTPHIHKCSSLVSFAIALNLATLLQLLILKNFRLVNFAICLVFGIGQ